MWQETTLNNISSGLYKVGSPLNALAAETFKNLQMRWYDFYCTVEVEPSSFFSGKPIQFCFK
jgi:hypothetical protein